MRPGEGEFRQKKAHSWPFRKCILPRISPSAQYQHRGECADSRQAEGPSTQEAMVRLDYETCTTQLALTPLPRLCACRSRPEAACSKVRAVGPGAGQRP